MRNVGKRILAAVLLLSLLVFSVVPVTAQAAGTGTEGKRYNIMLVIDGSGSLISQNAGYTDPTGMRYALIDELMGILEDDGHNIGAIVFSGTQSRSKNPTDEDMQKGIMLNTGFLSLDSLAPDGRLPKDYLVDEIRRVNVDLSKNGCTDIGTALLEAQRQLKQMQDQNGLESVVFLFTDGNTAFFGNPVGVVEKSIESRDTATLEMSKNGIRLFGAFLNNKGKLDDAEMIRLVCSANGISANSPEFGYSYVEIQGANSIHEATTNFLKFLGYIDDTMADVRYDDIHDTFTIPGIGVEEMNIRLFAPYGDDLPQMNVKITQPDGSVITGVPLKQSRTFRVYKLVDPQPGTWKLDITVPEGNALAYVYMPVVSLHIESVVEPKSTNLCVNKTAEFTCLLSQGGTAITDPAAYSGYDCKLEIRNVSDGSVKTYDVQANASGSLTQEVPLDTYGTFEVRTTFSCGDIVVSSVPVTLDLTNRKPVSHSVMLDLECGLFRPKSTDVDLSQYVSDPEDGTNLTFRIESASCEDTVYSLNGNVLTVANKNIGDNQILISAADSQGESCGLDIFIKTTSVTIWYVLGLVLFLIVACAIVIGVIWYHNSIRPDGQLIARFDVMNQSVSLNLDVPGVETTSKVRLDNLLRSALQKCTRNVAPGVSVQDAESILSPMTEALSHITVTTAVKKKNKKRHGAILVKQGKKKTVLYSSYVDIPLDDVTINVEFAAVEEPDPFDDPFGDNTPTSSPDSKKKQNPFDDDPF